MKKLVIKGCEGRGDAESPYLTRYTLLENDLFQLCLHIFHRSDADVMHDHPWDFWTLILWRGYYEYTLEYGYPDGDWIEKRRIWPGFLLSRKAEHAHKVELVKGKPAVTLVMMFKRRREWGFFTPKGWQVWQQYFQDNKC